MSLRSDPIPAAGGTNWLRALWHRLPIDLRRSGGRALIAMAAPRAGAQTVAYQAGAPLTVAGLLRNACGIGEGARLCAEMLERLAYPVALADLTPTFSHVNCAPPALQGPAAAGAPGGATIIHINPPLIPYSRLLLGRRRTAGQRIIGYWAWELPRIPREWCRAFDYVHEVWTPSSFCADAVRGFTGKPVHVVPHPVDAPRPSALRRADFGLPEDAFVALSMLHFGSGFARKNPLAAVRAFRQAFGDRRDALLIVKVTADTPLPWAEQALREAVADAPNIRLMQSVLSRPDLGALLAASDAVLSLHRSEGFGLVLAEAMRLGKPVVATGWSGNMEFMSADSAALVGHRLVPVDDPQGTYADDQMWAEPDVADAARWLARLADDRAFARALGAAAARHAEDRLGGEAYGRTVAAALRPAGG